MDPKVGLTFLLGWDWAAVVFLILEKNFPLWLSGSHRGSVMPWETLDEGGRHVSCHSSEGGMLLVSSGSRPWMLLSHPAVRSVRHEEFSSLRCQWC